MDSPTSSVSSPGPKPVNFDFHKSAVEQVKFKCLLLKVDASQKENMCQDFLLCFRVKFGNVKNILEHFFLNAFFLFIPFRSFTFDCQELTLSMFMS